MVGTSVHVVAQNVLAIWHKNKVTFCLYQPVVAFPAVCWFIP